MERRGRCSGCCGDREKLSARNPMAAFAPSFGHVRKRTRTATTSASTSPLRKTAPYGPLVHRLSDRAGRSPGSRVNAFIQPSRGPLLGFPVAIADEGSPLTVAGAATALPAKPADSVFPLASPERPGEPVRERLMARRAFSSQAALSAHSPVRSGRVSQPRRFRPESSADSPPPRFPGQGSGSPDCCRDGLPSPPRIAVRPERPGS